MTFKQRTLVQIADMICGNFETEESLFRYRSSSYLTEFFQDCDTDYKHDGSSRRGWVAETLREILDEPQRNANTPPETFSRVIRRLMDQEDAMNGHCCINSRSHNMKCFLATVGYPSCGLDG